MKIRSLQVTEFRGIRHLSLPLEGRSAVIWGDNGVGKSGIVDAIDFLLSGAVTRLSGRGAGDLSLALHGPHVRAASGDACIEADVALTDGVALHVTRWVSSPASLVGPAEVESAFRRVSDRGQHLLTRRDILSVITVPPRDRAEQINQLLNLSPIEQVRRRLVTLRNDSRVEATAACDRVGQQRIRLADLSRLPAYDHNRIVTAINERRRTLDLQPISTLAEDAAAGAPSAPLPDEAAARRVSARDALHAIIKLVSSAETLVALDRDLTDACRAANALIAIDEYSRVLTVAALIDMGASLLDGSGTCPLCDAQWVPDALARHIEEKHDTTRAAQEAQRLIATTVERLRSGVLNQIAARASAAFDAVVRMRPEAPPQWLTEWNTALQQAGAELANPLEALSSPDRQARIVVSVTPTDLLMQRLTGFAAAIPSSQEPESRTTAREQLIRMDQEVRNLHEAEASLETAQHLTDVAVLLHDSFIGSRNELLQELFDSVRDRFVEFYRFLHPEEAESFAADLGQAGRGGVDLAVDFHAAGRYPPNAVHSEGHQDSMGLCLFLALAEVLTGGTAPDLLLLDDVVMSVDMDHRAKVAELLKVHFPTTQFILTTHDRAWANYLQSAGVVRPADCWEFRTWDIETGPSVGRASDVCTKIEGQLAAADVPSAAETLRRHVEETLFNVCDAIGAPVKLHASAQYQAGDLGDPAFATLKRLITAGIRGARFLGDDAAIARLEAREAARARAHADIKVHEWSVSAQIHWNNLLRLTTTEFRRVADTYRAALALFACDACNSPLRLLFDSDGRERAVQCVCTNTAWAM